MRLLLSGGIVLALAAACGGRPELVPASEFRRAGAGDARAFAERDGIEVVAGPATRDTPSMRAEAVPIELSIRNRRDRAIFVALSDIWLAGSKWGYRALDPGSLDIRPLRTSVGLPPGEFDAPLGEQRANERGRSELDLAKERVRARSFHDGFVPAGDTVRGVVYFRRPRAGDASLVLHVIPRERAGGAPVTDVRIPFRVRD